MNAFRQQTHIEHGRGFSLIELMVAISIFSIVVLVSVSTLLVLIDANRRAQGIKTAMNNTFFSMESITRLIRTGQTYHCRNSVAAPNVTAAPQDCPNGGTHLYFIDDTARRVLFFWHEGRIWQSVNSGPNVPVTAADIRIDSGVRFYVTGAATSEQPVVTLTLVGTTGENTEVETSVELQTTVTQRLLDFQ